MGNGPIEGTITSILRHKKVYYSKCTLMCFLIFAANVRLLSLSIIKVIPLEDSTSKYT